MQLADETARRLRPRPWHTDWLVLSQLTKALTSEFRENLDKNTRLVDFGCGSMPYRQLAESFGAEYIGADLGSKGDVVISADGELNMAGNSVNAALSVQVLEHVRDLDRYCSEMHRVLESDGLVLLSTHGNWLYHPHPEDHRRWTRTGLVEDLEQRGFKVENMHAITGPLATTTLIRLTSFSFALKKIPFIGSFFAKALAIIMNARAVVEDMITPKNIRDDNSCVYLVRARKVTKA